MAEGVRRRRKPGERPLDLPRGPLPDSPGDPGSGTAPRMDSVEAESVSRNVLKLGIILQERQKIGSPSGRNPPRCFRGLAKWPIGSVFSPVGPCGADGLLRVVLRRSWWEKLERLWMSEEGEGDVQ